MEQNEVLSTEPVRIAQIVGKWNGGGVESVVMNYYRNIDRTRIQFDFFCDSDSLCIPYDTITALGGKVIVLPPYQKVAAYHKALKAELEKGGYRIVHSHLNTLSVFPLYAAKKAGVPNRIAHSHSTSNRKEFKRNLAKHILRPTTKWFATKMMCCSKLAGSWQFGRRSYEKGEVYLLNNAIDADRFAFNSAARTSIRSSLGISADTFVAGHVGRFCAQKNHPFLLEVFAEIHKRKSDSVLLLVGQGPDLEAVKDKAAQLGLSDCVLFLNQRNDVDKLYSVMDAFVLPSLYEGLPVVGVEAQCADAACFLSDAMTRETKIIEKTQFLSLSQSAAEWADAVLSADYTKRSDNRSALENAGFSIKNEAGKLETFYLNLI